MTAETEALWRFVRAWEVCDSGRGKYSQCFPHDSRCPARGRLPFFASRITSLSCVCGADELDNAYAELKHIGGVVEPVRPGTEPPFQSFPNDAKGLPKGEH